VADQTARRTATGIGSDPLEPDTGFSFRIDDNTVQIQLTSGSPQRLRAPADRNDVFEVDNRTWRFAYQPGSYRVEASEDGTYLVTSLREGEGEATGNGQTYTLHAGQRGTFSGPTG
jgi:hypothetical protein